VTIVLKGNGGVDDNEVTGGAAADCLAFASFDFNSCIFFMKSE